MRSEVKDKFLSGIFAIIASRLFRTRVHLLALVSVSGTLPALRQGRHCALPASLSHSRRGFQGLLYRLLLPAADHVFVQSEQMRTDIAGEGIPAEKMTAVPMGVRAELCDEPIAVCGSPVLAAGVPSILYLGTLDKVRRLDFMIRVFAKVLMTVPEARLYIVGRGEDPADEAFLENEVSRLELQSSVVFVGQLP